MMHNPSRKRPVATGTYYILTTALALAFLAPLLWAAVSSVSPAPGTSQLHGYGFNNYRTLFDYGLGLPTYLLHSVVISVVAVVVTVAVAASGGYAFARFSFRGRRALFVAVLAIMMVPYAALLLPMVVWTKQLGLQNSLVGTGLVLTLFQLPFGVLVMRNAFASIPKELEEAAAIDGCGAFGTFRRVMAPTVVPSLVTVGLFAYLAAWNDFMVSLYLLSMGNAPLPLALVNMRQQVMGVIDYGVTTAGVVVLPLPALVLFLALQKYYVKGVVSGAVKG